MLRAPLFSGDAGLERVSGEGSDIGGMDGICASWIDSKKEKRRAKSEEAVVRRFFLLWRLSFSGAASIKSKRADASERPPSMKGVRERPQARGSPGSGVPSRGQQRASAAAAERACAKTAAIVAAVIVLNVRLMGMAGQSGKSN